ncbi:hypothetical protein HY478_02015 [Candidatus Uhrbacteria bacterium]|nr:hypothetical protein [Candidatus Uhrbacteria bacterium]
MLAAFRLVDILVGFAVGLLFYLIGGVVVRRIYSRVVHPPVRYFAPTMARGLPAPDFQPRPRDGGACYRR